jgi:hypothetical protein
VGDLYRSGFMLRPPIALGGHAYTMVRPSQDAMGELFPAVPALWRCFYCFTVRQTGELPDTHCTGRAAALMPASKEARRG